KVGLMRSTFASKPQMMHVEIDGMLATAHHAAAAVAVEDESAHGRRNFLRCARRSGRDLAGPVVLGTWCAGPLAEIDPLRVALGRLEHMRGDLELLAASSLRDALAIRALRKDDLVGRPPVVLGHGDH